MEGSATTTRRNLLKLASVLTAAAFGWMWTNRSGNAHAAVTGPTPGANRESMKLYGRYWHLYSQERKKGERFIRGDQMIMYGELLKESQGQKVGEFYSTGMYLQTPLGPSPFAAANVEVHSINLADGTILGMGTSRALPGSENIYAVLGGTGRYQGAKGTYTARQWPVERGGDGSAEFTFDLTLQG